MEKRTQVPVTLAAMCRMDAEFVRCLAEGRNTQSMLLTALGGILIGTLAYGAVFGYWRAPLQAVYSGVKLPLLFLLVVAASGVINTMLGQVMGARLAFKTVVLLMLVGMAVTALLLGALSPVVWFFVAQAPPPDPRVLGQACDRAEAAKSMGVYRVILVMHVAIIGICGIVGNARLFRMIRAVTGSGALARRLLLAWILVSGFVGCELSWLLSPYLCNPVTPPHIVNRQYFESNFYEYVYHAVQGR
jgi:hypothetical protein